jgi:hypothetical protein
MLTLTFALKQRNLDQLETKFWSVSNPQSSDYGIARVHIGCGHRNSFLLFVVQETISPSNK